MSREPLTGPFGHLGFYNGGHSTGNGWLEMVNGRHSSG